MPELYIPNISNEKLNTLRDRIRPVGSFVEVLNPDQNSHPVRSSEKDQLHHFVYFPDARELGYDTRNPKLLKLLTLGDPRKTSFMVPPTPIAYANNLSRIMDMITYHTMGSIVKPSEAEVLAQIPDQLLDLVVSYYAHYEPNALTVVSTPHTAYHAVLTRLYKRG
jgi:hypothetical protein